MRPILFTILGIDVPAYGVSKALAALVAGALVARVFAKAGIERELGYSLAIWATVWGFAGAKAYYLLEHLPTVTVHDLGGTGFTWYGGLLTGTIAAMVMARRWQLRAGLVAGAVAAPLSVAYAIGRVGCFFAGDGTYGRPSTLPWAVTFPHGVVTTTAPVHPTPLYEAAGALLIAVVLWRSGRHGGARARGWAQFGWYLLLSGAARFLVEVVRTNAPAMLGLTQPQLWSLAEAVAGVVLIVRAPGADAVAPAVPAAGAPWHGRLLGPAPSAPDAGDRSQRAGRQELRRPPRDSASRGTGDVTASLRSAAAPVGPVGPVGPDASTPRSGKAGHAGPARRKATAPAQGGPRTATEVHLLLGAFVLGGLNADDVRTFRTHLASCARCRAELPGGRAVAAALALAGSRERRPSAP